MSMPVNPSFLPRLLIACDDQAVRGAVSLLRSEFRIPGYSVYEFRPDPSITIDTVRSIQRSCKMKTSGSARLIVLYSIHLATREAQNALLRLLEEPPEHTLFLLQAPSKSGILPTILSRTALMRNDSSRKASEAPRDHPIPLLLSQSPGQRILNLMETVTTPDQANTWIDSALIHLEHMLHSQTYPPGLTAKDIRTMIHQCTESRAMLRVNVSFKSVLDTLVLSFPQI